MSISYSMPRKTPLLAQVAAALVAGLIMFFAAVILWVLGYQLLYAGRIFPGVSVAGVDVSGLSPDAAAIKLSETLSYPIRGKVLLRDGDTPLVVRRPYGLGTACELTFDATSRAFAQSSMVIPIADSIGW